VGTATANISLAADYGKTYKVGIYLNNPLYEKTVTSLYTCSMQSGDKISVPVSYPLYVRSVYVAMFDEKGHRIVKSTSIADGEINVSFGGGAAHTRAVEANYTESYAKTFDEYLNPTTDQWGTPYNVDRVSLDDLGNYALISDQVIITQTSQGNHTLTDMNYTNEGNYYPGHGDGKHFRVPAGTEIYEVFNLNSYSGVINDVVLFVEGKVHLNGNTLNGATILVADGGELIIDGTTNMSNKGRYVIMAGGKVTGNNNVEFNVTNGAPCYNAGTINFRGQVNVNGSDLYNRGTINVDLIRNTTYGGVITNFGKITARTNKIAGDSYNMTLINGCYMHFTEDAGIGTLILLDNSRLDVDGIAEFNQNHQTLYNLSEINAGGLYLNATTFDGPTADGTYAVIKTQKILVGQGADLTVSGNLYFDWDLTNIYNHQDQQDFNCTVDNGYTYLSYIRGLNLNFVDEATADPSVTIPKGECTGNGYNPIKPEEEEEEIDFPEETPQAYRFCFEDNFPQFGDYDFNDAVVTVTPVVDGNVVHLKVSIDAVGASEQLGVAIRVMGVNMNDVEVEQDGKFDENKPNTDYPIIPGEEGKMDVSNLAPGETNLVIKLTSNIHWALAQRTMEGYTDMIENWFYNTVKRDDQFAAKRNDIPSRVVNYEITCKDEETAQKFVQENLDVFIVESYNGGYWEVHTVPYKTDEVIANYYSGNKSMYSDNFPWAICMPGEFRYPIEWQSIGFKENSVSGGAYPSFGTWAENQDQATDWYLYPTDGLVY
jgi:LruC domain-containing protein